MPPPIYQLRLCVARLTAFVALLLVGFVLGDGVRAQSLSSAPRAASVIDYIVVVVNDDVITSGELSVRMASVRRQLRDRNISPPPETVLKKQVLERMILERIQLQRAERLGVRADEREIEDAIKQVAERNRMTVKGLYRA
ncbi:MAG: SurA N-terminal domain-containing protein, partial [Acidiferrobacterales bacterium]